MTNPCLIELTEPETYIYWNSSACVEWIRSSNGTDQEIFKTKLTIKPAPDFGFGTGIESIL